MKKTFVALLLACAPVILASAKDEVTRTVAIPDFTALECNIPCEIHFSAGQTECQVTMPAKLEGHLVTKVTDGTLVIELDKASSFKFGNVSINLKSLDLKSISLNGAVDFEADSKISPDSLSVSLNGAAEFDVKGLDADTVAITANGASSVEIEGLVCENLKVTVNGAGGGEIEGFARKADLKINGVGSIDIKKLKVENMNTAVNGIGKISRD